MADERGNGRSTRSTRGTGRRKASGNARGKAAGSASRRRTSASDASTDDVSVDGDGDHTDQAGGGGDEIVEGNGNLPAVVQNATFGEGMLNYERIPSGLAEGLRGIINRYELRAGEPLPQTVAVTSALLGEGVTTVSKALATLIAQEMGRFVCWVDCSWLAVDAPEDDNPDGQTLLDILADPSRILSAFQTSPDLPQLVVLSPGSVPESKRNIIVRSPEFERLLNILTEEFDHVIFDIPPVLSNANGLALLRQSDVSLLVVRHRLTSISQVRRAITATEPTPNLGIVLNRFRPSIPARIRRLLGD